jgi:surfeit locus 1 family protein
VWVATPLRLTNGDAVVILRGFLPTQGIPDAVPADAEPPTGTVSVEGLLQETQTRGAIGPTDPSEGQLTNLARVDIERWQKQVPYRLYPAYVQLQRSDPSQAGPEPEVLPEPALDEGPHLGYAVQWFIFTIIAAVGYPLILRRSARNREPDDFDNETNSFLLSHDDPRAADHRGHVAVRGSVGDRQDDP